MSNFNIPPVTLTGGKQTMSSWAKVIKTFAASILTDKEVILIEEVESKAENRGVSYGGIFQYIPLQHIAASGITETANDLMTLSLSPAFGRQTSPQPHSARSAGQAFSFSR